MKQVTSEKKVRVGFASLGCSKNLVDSEIMISRLAVDGFELVQDPAEAEVLVVNTCGFIDSAKEESINTILEMAKYKDIGECRRLVVSGCLGHRYRQDLLNSIPEIDAIIGLDELHKIEDACRGVYRQKKNNPQMSRRLYGVADARVSTTSAGSRYLKISEGCDHKCSFCVIPTFRGLHRSRAIDDVYGEAVRLVEEGAAELNLVAQDLGAYGKDLNNFADLPALLRKLSTIDDLGWLRMHYIYPQGLSLELQETIASVDKCVPYLDIPFQHGSSKVLKDMRRPGNTISTLKKIAELRRNIPDIAIRTSIIVGFPTEEESDFQQLIDLVEEVRFEHLGVFKYSHEENSFAAEKYEDVIPDQLKEERRQRIMEIQQKISFENNQRFVDRKLACYIEGLHEESDMLLSGRLATQAPEVDGNVIITDGIAEAGTIVEVEILEAHAYDLVGRII